MKKFLAAIVTAAVTLSSCVSIPAFATPPATTGILVAAPRSAATSYVILARWKGKDGENRSAPYAPKDKLILFANELSCKAALETEAVQTSISGLKLVLLMNEGEDAMDSLVVDCQQANEVQS